MRLASDVSIVPVLVTPTDSSLPVSTFWTISVPEFVMVSVVFTKTRFSTVALPAFTKPLAGVLSVVEGVSAEAFANVIVLNLTVPSFVNAESAVFKVRVAALSLPVTLTLPLVAASLSSSAATAAAPTETLLKVNSSATVAEPLAAIRSPSTAAPSAPVSAAVPRLTMTSPVTEASFSILILLVELVDLTTISPCVTDPEARVAVLFEPSPKTMAIAPSATALITPFLLVKEEPVTLSPI